MPAVVIDVGDAQPPRDLVVALVDACTQAAAPAGTECHLVRDAQNEPYAAIAIVTWEEGGKVRVEVGVRREPVSEWRTRELTFQAQDAEIERYKSIGFVIGSLATATRDEAAPEAATPPPERPEPPPPPPKPAPVVAAAKATPKSEAEREAPPSPPGPSHGWIGVTGTIGGGLDRGKARYGGRFGAGVRVIAGFAAIVSAGGSFRARDEKGLTARWLDVGLGLGYAIWPPEGSHLELRAEVVAEQFTAEALQNGETRSMVRTTAGFRPGVDGVLMLVRPIALVAGVDATFRPATTISVGGEGAGSTRNFELGAAAGFRLEL